MNTLSDNLKYYMNIKEISNYKLSKDSGIAKGYVTELENGIKCNPSILIISKLSKALGITPNDLIPENMYRRESKDGTINNS